MRPKDFEKGLTATRLYEVVRYDPKTGKFFWLHGNNQKQAGDEAGSLENTKYIRLTIDGERYQAHRIAWLYMTGEWPSDRIDHENLNRSDNRWDNLREASDSENKRNQRVTKANFLGIKGVRLHEGGKYIARIMAHGKSHYLGVFNTVEAAKAAREVFAKRLHGEFARME